MRADSGARQLLQARTAIGRLAARIRSAERGLPLRPLALLIVAAFAALYAAGGLEPLDRALLGQRLSLITRGSSWSPGGGGGGGGGGPAFPGGGPGGLSDWWGTLGDAPVFEAPTWESAMEDPGYQAALKAGEGALERSQAARGVLRSGGSLKDLLDYNQCMAAKQYDSAWQRALGKYQTEYAPWATKFGAGENRWATMYGGDLAKWQTQYQGDLAKYLQKEGNLFDLLNSPPPMYGG